MGRLQSLKIQANVCAYVLQQAHKRYGKRCVVLIEGYDKPILDVLDSGYSFSSETGTIEEWKATER